MATTAITMVMEQEPESQTEVQKAITQKEILEITLSGPVLLLTIAALIMSIQILRPSLACILLALAPLPWIIHNDYVNFINLGPGGTPSTFFGYLKISYLRLFALTDPYTPATYADFPERIFPATGYFQGDQSWLPFRYGSRPTIAGIAPQRQLDQPGCPKTYYRLRKSLETLAINHPDTFRIGTSCFEKKGLALFARDPINATCRGEICHVHHSDRSMHMNLHPDDAKIVLQKGWGERHPLAKGGWMAKYVPREFVMIYAPRNETELAVVCRIIEAASYWVCESRLEIEAVKEMIRERNVEAGAKND